MPLGSRGEDRAYLPDVFISTLPAVVAVEQLEVVDIHSHHIQAAKIRILKLCIYLVEEILLVWKSGPLVDQLFICLVLTVYLVRKLCLLLEKAYRGKHSSTDYPLGIRSRDEVEGSEIKGLLDISGVIGRRDHDDRHIVSHMLLFHLGQHIKSADTRHDKVEKHYTYMAYPAPYDLKALLTVLCFYDIDLILQNIL